MYRSPIKSLYNGLNVKFSLNNFLLSLIIASEIEVGLMLLFGFIPFAVSVYLRFKSSKPCLFISALLYTLPEAVLTILGALWYSGLYLIT